jgi:hypothetical protein
MLSQGNQKCLLFWEVAVAAATGSLETRYRVQKCAGEWTVGGVQRGEGAEHLG